MKHFKTTQAVILACSLALFMLSCGKADKNEIDLSESISTADRTSTENMDLEILAMRNAVDSMIATPHQSVKHHWDSSYHHHDSLFWHHHSVYTHGNGHDDHTHHYTPHHTPPNYHQLHHYPGHPNDSLIIVIGIHHHNSTNYHHHLGHDLHHHNQLDSIHNIHNIHHP